MAWPSGTKASTANVDAGTDRPSNARADIKQNIDNVNDIIDHLNISSPSDGDILQYSSSTGKWEQVAVSSLSTGVSIARFNTTSAAGTNTSGDTYRRPISGTGRIDTDSIVTFNADDERFTLGAGTYIIQAYAQAEDTEVEMTMNKESDGTTVVSVTNFNEVGTSGESVSMLMQGFTLGSSTEVGLRQTSTNSIARNASVQIMLFKVA